MGSFCCHIVLCIIVFVLWNVTCLGQRLSYQFWDDTVGSLIGAGRPQSVEKFFSSLQLAMTRHSRKLLVLRCQEPPSTFVLYMPTR